jgi:hypothetical protein
MIYIKYGQYTGKKGVFSKAYMGKGVIHRMHLIIQGYLGRQDDGFPEML